MVDAEQIESQNHSCSVVFGGNCDHKKDQILKLTPSEAIQIVKIVM